MATSYKGQASRVHITSAAAAVTGGVAVVEDGWAGIPLTDAATGAAYTLAVEGEFEVDFITSSAVGDYVLIAESDNALTRAASLPSSGSAKRLFAKVTAVPGASGTGTYGNFPVSGKMWIKLYTDAAQLPASYA